MPVARGKTTNTPSAVAVIYARYSSHAQRDVSIEQQVAECQEYAEANNLEVVAVYADRHLTGRSDNRPEFQKMMRHAEKRQFQVIIAWKSDRISRNMLHALQYEDRLSKYGVRVAYAKEEFGDNAAGRFALRTMMNVNQFYSENMAEDIKRGMLDNAENCMITNGQLPFGYKKGEDGRYAIDEDRAAVVREIFTRVACGEAFVDIAADLNRRGIKTSRGNRWGKSSFYSILKNERYTGVYIYDTVRVEGGVPQIIGKELFHIVQERLRTKKNPQGRHRVNGDYLLTGKLYCGKCKAHMIGMSGTSRTGDLHYYYACQAKRTEKTCDKSNVRRDWAEEKVAMAIRQYILRDDVIEWIAESVHQYGKKRKNESELGILEEQLRDVTKAIKNLLAAIEAGIITETTKNRLLELEGEQSKLSARIAITKSEIPEVAKEDIIVWLESFRDGEVHDKKYQAKLFDTFLLAVYLYEDNIKLVFNFTGKNSFVDVPIDTDVIDNIEKNEPPHDGSLESNLVGQTNPYTNPNASLYMSEGMFVLVCSL
jgi:site-specific DNA recombinase